MKNKLTSRTASFTLLVIAIISIHCETKPKRSKYVIQFAGEKWIFPSTIGEAVERNNLLYIGPAFYHKMWGNTRQVTLSFDWKSGDFADDNNKEPLYERNVNTYTFRFKRTENTYDSLKLAIENTYHKKFKLVTGIRTTTSLLIEQKVRPFQHQLIQVDKDLTIGIKNSNYHELGDIVTVNFLYGLSLGDIGNRVGNP